MKLKLVHILNNLNSEREINSIKSLSTLKNLGVDYIQQVTPLYDGDDWKIKTITNLPGNIYSKGHYGCYLSFMKAIKENFTDDLDALILCECDCILNIPQESFLSEMNKTLDFCRKHDVYQFSWGGRIGNDVDQGYVYKIDKDYPNYCITSKIIGTHFIILTKDSREFFLKKVDSMGWDASDIWFNESIYSEFSTPSKQATVFNKLAYQCEGISSLDDSHKNLISSDMKISMPVFEDNDTFNITTDINNNMINISCDLNIDAEISIYDWNIVNNYVKLLYKTHSQFNKNTLWYAPAKSLIEMNGIKIDIKLNDTLIEKNIILREIIGRNEV